MAELEVGLQTKSRVDRLQRTVSGTRWSGSKVTFDWNTLERSVLDGILKRLFNQLDRDGNGQDRRI